MKSFKLLMLGDRFYIVNGSKVYFFSHVRKKFIPALRTVESLMRLDVMLISNNFKPNDNPIFKHVK